jgi:hypothetical protein
MLKIYKNNSGSIIIPVVIVFGFAFLTILGGLFMFVLLQNRESIKRIGWEQSFEVAEAGINYYQWCLNNGIEDSCDMNKNYFDSQGNPVGGFSINVVSDNSCGEIISRKIYSTGHSDTSPSQIRKIGVIYARTSVAKYAYLINSNIWAGPDRQIGGVYHTNGGVRMDGKNDSLVSSAQAEWTCTDSFGCSPCPINKGCRIQGGSCLCPGVFTTTNNSTPDLFNFPVPSFSFDNITIDLAKIKSKAQSSSVYLSPSAQLNSRGKGYHVIFKNDGSFDVMIITKLSGVSAYNIEEGWHTDNFIISQESFYRNYNIDSSCPIIFVEDNLWLEGVITKKVTIASANLISANANTSVVLTGNLTYSIDDGSCGLSVISQNNILISPNAPNDMELNGIFIAQKGRFGINHYDDNIKGNLEIMGSIISNGREGTQWTSGSFTVSGFSTRQTYIDSKLIYEPPPFVPYTEYEYKMIRWEEVK